MKNVTFKRTWKVFKHAGEDFSKNKVFKMSASLAYYTIFSLGPMLMVIIFLATFFYSKEAIEGKLYLQVKNVIGLSAADQIQEIIKSAALSGKSTLSAIIGFVALLVGATTVFSDMQDSLNSIWNLKLKPTKDNWIKMLLNRFLSFSMVVGLGFLLLVSLIVSSLLDGLMGRLQQIFPDMAVIAAYIINLLISMAVVTFLFALIYKVLPDALIKWRDVIVGAGFTAFLFMVGKFAISFYIGSSDVGNSYGAAGSIVVLMLWVYFSSLILYFGAEFTKMYAMEFGSSIRPNDYAVTMQVAEVETAKRTIQENEKDAEITNKNLQKEKDQEKTDPGK